MFSISGIVHLRSNALDRTILKIWVLSVEVFGAWMDGSCTFCTLML